MIKNEYIYEMLSEAIENGLKQTEQDKILRKIRTDGFKQKMPKLDWTGF